MGERARGVECCGDGRTEASVLVRKREEGGPVRCQRGESGLNFPRGGGGARVSAVLMPEEGEETRLSLDFQVQGRFRFLA